MAKPIRLALLLGTVLLLLLLFSYTSTSSAATNMAVDAMKVVKGFGQPLEGKRGACELLNTSTGECVHGLFFPDRRLPRLVGRTHTPTLLIPQTMERWGALTIGAMSNVTTRPQVNGGMRQAWSDWTCTFR